MEQEAEHTQHSGTSAHDLDDFLTFASLDTDDLCELNLEAPNWEGNYDEGRPSDVVFQHSTFLPLESEGQDSTAYNNGHSLNWDPLITLEEQVGGVPDRQITQSTCLEPRDHLPQQDSLSSLYGVSSFMPTDAPYSAEPGIQMSYQEIFSSNQTDTLQDTSGLVSPSTEIPMLGSTHNINMVSSGIPTGSQVS